MSELHGRGDARETGAHHHDPDVELSPGICRR